MGKCLSLKSCKSQELNIEHPSLSLDIFTEHTDIDESDTGSIHRISVDSEEEYEEIECADNIHDLENIRHNNEPIISAQQPQLFVLTKSSINIMHKNRILSFKEDISGNAQSAYKNDEKYVNRYVNNCIIMNINRTCTWY